MKSKNKKTIAFLVTEASYFLSHRLPLALAALKKGYKVILLTAPQHHQQKLESLGFKVYPLRYMTRANCTLWRELKSLYEIYKIYKKIRPHVVHQVAMKPVLYGTIAARLARVPLVINALAGLGYAFTAHTPKATFLKYFILFFLKPLLKHKNTHLIVQNKDDFSFFSSLVFEKNLHLIRGSGVNLQEFSPPPRPAKNPVFTVALAARLLWDKGIKEAIEAIQILKKKHLKIRLIIAGGLDPQNPSAIPESVMQTWVKEGHCEWLDHITNIAAFYQGADVAILPSYREGLPKSLLEAAACGLPLAATDVPGCREIVVPGENGLLVAPRNPAQLAEALEFLYHSPRVKAQLGIRSRFLAEEYFSEEIVVKQTLALYTSRYYKG